jgi:methyltransferase
MVMDGVDSRVTYTALVGVVAVMRLVELAVSRRHIARLKGRGAVEVGRSHYPWMVVVHTSFLAACVVEVWLLNRPWVPPLGFAMLALLVGAAALRCWVIVTLGDRWSTRVLFVPGEAPVVSGPYRWLRHPNYLAVVVEFVALPMVHTAWLTAVVFSVANGLVLRARIPVEEAALEGDIHEGGRVGPRSRLAAGR